MKTFESTTSLIINISIFLVMGSNRKVSIWLTFWEGGLTLNFRSDWGLISDLNGDFTLENTSK